MAGVAGDQQAALFGQACLDPGLGKNTYGTGSFVLLNTGAAPPPPASGPARHRGLGDRRRSSTYALEAAIFVTGAAVQWLRDGLGVIERADETDALAGSLEGNDGVYFVPALTGLGSPYWDPYARGTIVGLTRGQRPRPPRPRDARGHRLPDGRRGARHGGGRVGAARRAARPTAARRSTRGSCSSRPTCSACRWCVPEVAETTALGAAYLAGVGAGLLTLDRVREGWRERARYEPAMGADERDGAAGRLGPRRRARQGVES